LKNSPKPRVGQTGPCRPYPPYSYQAQPTPLPDLFRLLETEGGAEVMNFHLTPRLAGGRWADTYSHGLACLPSGSSFPVCTTFSRRGKLLLEIPKGKELNIGALADIARAVVAGHVREQARQSSLGRRN